MAYNTGFNAAKGDVVLINSSECIHAGDIIGYVFSHLESNMYLNFSAFMGDTPTNIKLNKINWVGNIDEQIRDIISLAFKREWGCHSTIGNFIPYCAAINRKDLETLSGYDERFVEGIGFDDYDFTDRIYNLGLNTIAVDYPFCIHQYHPTTVYSNSINLDLLWYLRNNFPKRIKPEKNKIYVR
jgi:hypothetical protein